MRNIAEQLRLLRRLIKRPEPEIDYGPLADELGDFLEQEETPANPDPE